MNEFSGRIAVVTGGGSGMGRELVAQLAAEGCDVAFCDVSADAMAETLELARAGAASGVRLTTFVADVSDRAQMDAFQRHVAESFSTDHIHLLFNNAGIGGGGSVIHDSSEQWDRVFGICWGGVLNGTRAFLPMLVAADEAHLVNTSSINGFWAALGPDIAHTAYSAAKFAVKGFTEALITDFALHAPHVHAHVVMPGHIGTSIIFNSGTVLGRDPKNLTSEQIAEIRDQFGSRGMDLSGVSDEDIRMGVLMRAEAFRDTAPTTAADASAIILNGVRAGTWRILVGDDAVHLDEKVRADPTRAYTREFFDELRSEGTLQFGQG